MTNPAKVIAFIVFIIVGSVVEALMIKLFAYLGVKSGNGGAWLVQACRDRYWTVVLVMLIINISGVIVSLPTAIREGFFAD